MKRNTLAILALAAAVVIASTAFAAAPVQAQSGEDSSVVDALFSDDEDDTDTWELISSAVSGFVDKYSPLADRPEEADAAEYGDRVQSEFNSNSGVLMDWTNSRTTASTDMDVVRLKFKDESGNTAYRFVVADVNATTGNYTNAQMVNASEFDSLDREVDTTYRLSPYASRNAADELETFVDEYAEPGENVTQSYLAHLAGEYKGEVEGEHLPGGDE